VGTLKIRTDADMEHALHALLAIQRFMGVIG